MKKVVEVKAGDQEYINLLVTSPTVDTDPHWTIGSGGPVQVLKWPRKAAIGTLRDLIQKHATGWYGEPGGVADGPDKIFVSVYNLEIFYRRVVGSYIYRLVGVQHADHLAEGWVLPQVEGYERLAGELMRVMPGLSQITAYPCSCNDTERKTTRLVRDRVKNVIIHLNDAHHPDTKRDDVWDRERIAQWTETLDIDLTVDTSAPPPARRQVVMTDQQKAQMLKVMASIDIKVDMTSMKKAIEETGSAFAKVTESLEGLKKTVIDLEIKNVSPETFELLTGQPYPKDNEEEA